MLRSINEYESLVQVAEVVVGVDAGGGDSAKDVCPEDGTHRTGIGTLLLLSRHRCVCFAVVGNAAVIQTTGDEAFSGGGDIAPGVSQLPVSLQLLLLLVDERFVEGFLGSDGVTSPTSCFCRKSFVVRVGVTIVRRCGEGEETAFGRT